MTPSTFLEMHVKDILCLNIDYAFLRNSKGYPQELTGDIDLLVKRADLKKIHNYYKELRRHDIRVVQIISKRNDLYVMLFFHQGGDRKYLVLEYFTGIVFKGQVILPGEPLLKDCDVDGIWRRLPDRLSISYTFFHYIIYKGELPSKYQNELDIHGLDQSVSDSVINFIGDNITDDEKLRLFDNTFVLQDRIKQRISWFKTMLHYISQLLRLRRENFGCVLKVNPVDTQAVIDFAEEYHLYRPTYRFLLGENPIFSAAATWMIIPLGGLAILTRSDIISPKSVEEYFDAKIND